MNIEQMIYNAIEVAGSEQIECWEYEWHEPYIDPRLYYVPDEPLAGFDFRDWIDGRGSCADKNCLALLKIADEPENVHLNIVERINAGVVDYVENIRQLAVAENDEVLAELGVEKEEEYTKEELMAWIAQLKQKVV